MKKFMPQFLFTLIFALSSTFASFANEEESRFTTEEMTLDADKALPQLIDDLEQYVTSSPFKAHYNLNDAMLVIEYTNPDDEKDTLKLELKRWIFSNPPAQYKITRKIDSNDIDNLFSYTTPQGNLIEMRGASDSPKITVEKTVTDQDGQSKRVRIDWVSDF